MRKAVGSLLILFASIPAYSQPGKAAFYSRQARILFEQEMLREAEQYADSAVAQFGVDGLPDSVARITLLRYEIRKARRDFESALLDYLAAAQHGDSLEIRKNREATKALLDSIGVEKKNWQRDSLGLVARLDALTESNRKDWQSMWLVMGSLIALLAIVIYLLYRRRLAAQSELAEAKVELQRLQAFREKLFAVLSYDLKNLLTSFENLSQGLSGQLQNMSREDSAQMLSNLHSTATELKDTLDNVVHWVALQANAKPFHPVSFDCKLLADEVTRKFQWRFKARNLAADLFMPDNQIVYADREMIALVIENLVSNAIQFTPQGGKVTLFSGRKDGLVMIGVKDTGKGIRDEDLQKLFDAKEDFHAIGKPGHKGAGVGLLVTRDLVERNGGRVYVESKVGEGSTFYFTLPEKTF